MKTLQETILKNKESKHLIVTIRKGLKWHVYVSDVYGYLFHEQFETEEDAQAKSDEVVTKYKGKGCEVFSITTF